MNSQDQERPPSAAFQLAQKTKGSMKGSQPLHHQTTLEEPYRTRFFDGIRKAIDDAGGTITIYDSYPLYFAKKSCV